MVLLGPTAYSLPARIQEIASEHDALNDAIQSGQADAAEAAAKYIFATRQSPLANYRQPATSKPRLRQNMITQPAMNS